MESYIEFVETKGKPKTKVWLVKTKPATYGQVLGEIKWFGRWRAYSFFPGPETVFEKICLRDIANFCEQKTKEHRENKKNAQML